jgi:2-polyprenyl-6-methoxyphenol hydroxylase-like FAD-dependent oxidoreductase
MRPMIVIAGAGIGGLTLGCALARAGLPFVIFERAAELRPVGAGIALSQNAFAALAHLGLEQAARAAGQEMNDAIICDHLGRVLLSSPVRQFSEGGAVALARADLQSVLLNALVGPAVTGDPVELGRAVRGYRARPGGVLVELEDGAEVKADLLVGADGLHSTVRRLMRGPEPLRYAGYTSWRALVDGVDLPGGARVTESWGPGQRFGMAPLGGGRVYWFGVADAPAGERDAADPRPALLARFAGWHTPIEALISATPPARILRTDINDRPPIDRWIEGYVALLGDAAHPMTPNLGQGGCQAIEDAVVLATALARHRGVQPALLHYQKRRLARANSFVVRSRRFGQIAHLRPAPMRWLRDRALRAIPTGLTARAAARDLRFQL